MLLLPSIFLFAFVRGSSPIFIRPLGASLNRYNKPEDFESTWIENAVALRLHNYPSFWPESLAGKPPGELAKTVPYPIFSFYSDISSLGEEVFKAFFLSSTKPTRQFIADICKRIDSALEKFQNVFPKERLGDRSAYDSLWPLLGVEHFSRKTWEKRGDEIIIKSLDFLWPQLGVWMNCDLSQEPDLIIDCPESPDEVQPYIDLLGNVESYVRKQKELEIRIDMPNFEGSGQDIIIACRYKDPSLDLEAADPSLIFLKDFSTDPRVQFTDTMISEIIECFSKPYLYKKRIQELSHFFVNTSACILQMKEGVLYKIGELRIPAISGQPSLRYFAAKVRALLKDKTIIPNGTRYYPRSTPLECHGMFKQQGCLFPKEILQLIFNHLTGCAWKLRLICKGCPLPADSFSELDSEYTAHLLQYSIFPKSRATEFFCAALLSIIPLPNNLRRERIDVLTDLLLLLFSLKKFELLSLLNEINDGIKRISGDISDNGESNDSPLRNVGSGDSSGKGDSTFKFPGHFIFQNHFPGLCDVVELLSLEMYLDSAISDL